MYLDTGTLVNLLFVFCLVFVTTAFFAVATRSNIRDRYKLLFYSIILSINYNKRLLIEDYLSFEKYQIWRYTIHKDLPSKI